MSLVKRAFLISAMLFLCVGCDQTSKAAAKSFLPQTQAWSYVGDTLRLQVAYNKGAFLSLGESLSDAWRLRLLSIGVGCVLAAILAYALTARSLRALDIIALSLLLGGGVSNLADRVLYHGYVLDFINMGVGTLRTGIFNFADVAISSGVLLVLYGQFANRQTQS